MRALAVALVVTTVLAACGGGGNNTQPTATLQPASAPTPSPQSTATPRPAATSAPPTSSTLSVVPSPPSPAAMTETATSEPSVAATAAEASPTAPPAQELACGAEITSSVTLANDLTCDPVGLVVAADGIVLDLGGHTITGPGPGTRTWPLPKFDVPGVLVRANNVTVRNGTVLQFGLSVLINEVSGAMIQNVKTDGSYFGIYLYKGGRHRVENCTVTNNVYGLHLQESSDNTVLDNNLSEQTHHSPGGYGLYLYAANSNYFEGNTVSHNLNWGLWFSESTGNTIVRNNIIGNNPQVSDDSGGNTYYDADKREGNYWSDYQGEDANSDGIGDVPYGIGGPGRSADIYPFEAENGWQNRATQTLAPAATPTTTKLPPRVYVALADGSIAAIDPASGTSLGVWAGAATTGSMSVSPDGTRLYAVVGSPQEDGVATIDTATGEVMEQWKIPRAQVVAAMYNGERVIVSTPDELVEVVLASGEFRDEKDGASAVSITPSWKHNIVLVADAAWNLDVVYLPNQRAPYKMPLPGKPVQVVDNRAGTRLFALLEGQPIVLVIDTEQFLATDEVPLGDIQAVNARLAPSPDGTTLYILDTAVSRVIAVDLGTKQIIASAKIDGEAVDLGISADGSYVSVATRNGVAGQLVVFDAQLRQLASVDLEAAPLGMAVSK